MAETKPIRHIEYFHAHFRAKKHRRWTSDAYIYIFVINKWLKFEKSRLRRFRHFPAVQRVLTGPVAVLAHDLLVETRGGQLLADVAVGDAREAQSDRRLHFVVRIAAAAARGSQCHARRDRHPAFIPRIRRQFHNTTL